MNAMRLLTAALGLLAVASAASADLSNPDFESSLSPAWTVNTGGSVSLFTDGLGDSFALFTEPTIPGPASSSLFQDFVIAPGLESLSFEYMLGAQGAFNDGGQALPDAFTARLLDPVSLNPIVGATSYFYHDTRGVSDSLLFDAGLVTLDTTASRPDWQTVTIDLSSLAAGTSARLQFDLFGTGILDGQSSYAGVDNLGITAAIIPAPSAALLALIGFGLIARFRRRGVERN